MWQKYNSDKSNQHIINELKADFEKSNPLSVCVCVFSQWLYWGKDSCFVVGSIYLTGENWNTKNTANRVSLLEKY